VVATTDTGADIDELLAAADGFADQGRHHEAIDRLTAANRAGRHHELEQRLVALRHQAFNARSPEPGPEPWPASYDDPFAGTTGVPEVAGADLTSEYLGGALLHHGSLLVRGLLPPHHVERLRSGIDRVLEALERSTAVPGSSPAPWFVPFDPPESPLGPMDRLWVLKSGTIYAGDAPRVLFDLLDAVTEVGLDRVIAGYLGEAPVISLVKTAVRRLAPDAQGGWHQDGQFLGDSLRVVNSWIALSDCGEHAPGLDLVPRRLAEIVPTGTDGAPFDWCVGQGMVDRVAEATPVVRPHFEAGDALLFDDHLLHRTGEGPGMTLPRYGVESWFFAPSAYPGNWVPLAI